MRLGACLSLTGRFGRFGRQAAEGLHTWQRLTAGVTLEIEDDGSDPQRVAPLVRRLAATNDLLLGPYSTQLMREAAHADVDALLWNHGGAGDDVQALAPGRIVSVLAPTSRYALPFLRAREPDAPLWVARGPGEFGRQVAAGARGIERDAFDDAPAVWDLFSCGRFEDDVAIVRRARAASSPPRAICSIAAGVRDFAREIDEPEGIYGIAQWFAPGETPELGPPGDAFGHADYPAVQAVAAAVLATRCAQVAGSLDRDALWAAAASLDTTTLLGRFRIDPGTGAQVGHTPVLVQWRSAALRRVG